MYVQDAMFAWVGSVIAELWRFDFTKNTVMNRLSKAKRMVYLQKNVH